MDNLDIIDSIRGFERKSPSIIMVLGVGGAGGNAVDHMYDVGIKDVTFMVCNTDRQALEKSPIENKIQLGEGLGAGNDPAKGRKAAIETLDEVMLRFEQEGTKMVFITAGMGGGTGTGAAPVIAKAAKEKGLLTVGIVTLPFRSEGRKRVEQAQAGLEELRKNVDSLVVIHNDNISKIYGSLPIQEAFGKADDILATAAKGVAELITRRSFINVDFADVDAVMRNSGMALMGSARLSGGGQIEKVVEEALNSPLLNHQNVRGAKNILFNLSYSSSQPLTMNECTMTLDLIQKRASKDILNANEANIIWGAGEKESLDDEIELTIVATGFDNIDTNTVKPQLPPDQPGKMKMPFASLRANDVLQVKRKDRYNDIEAKHNRPAYIERGMNLAGISGKYSKVQIKQDDDDDSAKSNQGNATLF